MEPGQRSAPAPRSLDMGSAKNCLIVSGTSPSKLVVDTAKDLQSLLKPHVLRLSKKNDIRPFENKESLEFLCSKNSCTTFMHLNSNKKHPNALTLGTTYDGQVVMMFELCVTNFIPLDSHQAPHIGTKCALIFQGSEFENDLRMSQLKVLLIDIFRKDDLDKLDPTSLEYAMVFTSSKIPSFEGSTETKIGISLRCFRIATDGATLTPMGTGFDAWLSRNDVQTDLLKLATAPPPKPKRTAKERETDKNITKDVFGNTMGRVYVAGEDLSKLPLRKFDAFQDDKK